MVITWSRFARMKFHLVKPGQISLYHYMWKLNFVPAQFSTWHLFRWWLHDPGLRRWDFTPSRRDRSHPTITYGNWISSRQGGTVFHLAFVQICMQFFCLFRCNLDSLRNWKPIDFHWFKFFPWVISILVHKIRSSRSQLFFKMMLFKVSQYSPENISVGVSY